VLAKGFGSVIMSVIPPNGELLTWNTTLQDEHTSRNGYMKEETNECGIGTYPIIPSVKGGKMPFSDFNVAHAQYGASFLTMIINNAQEQGLAYTNYFEPINEGALQVLQFSVTPTPLGVLMSIFGSLAGSTRLLLSTQTSTVANTDIIGVAAISKDSSSDISSINVILTNRNASTSYSQMILIDGQTVATTASVTVLNATGFTTGSFFISETFSVPILSGWITVPIPPFSITTFSVVCLSC
jgi:hypothetical protein